MGKIEVRYESEHRNKVYTGISLEYEDNDTDTTSFSLTREDGSFELLHPDNITDIRVVK